MRRLTRLYDGLLLALAWVAGAIPLFILFAIVLNVLTRGAGLHSPVWIQAYTELSLLFCTMFAAPWLVRRKGHVFVESFVARAPAGLRRGIERFVYLLCIAVCLIIFYYSLGKVITHISSGEFEARSVDVPLWLVFSSMPPAFLMMAIEFGRFLFGRDTMYSGTGTIAGGA